MTKGRASVTVKCPVCSKPSALTAFQEVYPHRPPGMGRVGPRCEGSGRIVVP